MKTEATDGKCTYTECGKNVSYSGWSNKFMFGWARPMPRQLTYDKTINPAKITNTFKGSLGTQNDSHPYVKCTWKYWAFLWVPTLFFRQIVRFFNELRSHIKICDNATNELKLSKRRQSKRECNNKERNRSNKQNKSFESASDFQTDFFTWSEWNAIV